MEGNMTMSIKGWYDYDDLSSIRGNSNADAVAMWTLAAWFVCALLARYIRRK